MVTQTGGRRRRRTGKKRKASAAFMKAGNSWRAHIKDTMRKNPSMRFGKKLLKLASRTYKKGVKTLRPEAHKAKKRTKRPKRTRRLKKRKSIFGF